MSTQQLNPYHDNIPIATFQYMPHAMVFQHGMFKEIQQMNKIKQLLPNQKRPVIS